MRHRWIITRPQPEAEADVAALRAAGLDAVALPVLERVDLEWAAERPDLVLISSASVLPAVLRAWEGWSPAPRVAAMAPETASKAARAGLQVDVAAAGGAVALAEAVLAAWARLGSPRRALYPTSGAGRDSPEQRAAIGRLETRMMVASVAVVDLRTPEDLEERLASAPPDAAWVFASPSAARAVLSTHAAPIPSRVLCHGASTHQALLAQLPAGWPAPLRASAGTVVEAVLDVEPPAPTPSERP